MPSKVSMEELKARKGEVLDSIRRHGGRIKSIARDFEVDRSYIYRLRDADREIAQALEGARADEATLLTIHDLREMPEAQIAKALEDSLGIPQQAAKKLGTRSTVLRRFLSEEVHLKALFEEVRENVDDALEYKMLKEALEGHNNTMKIWVSKARLVGRGYMDRPPDERKAPQNIQITINAPGIHGGGKVEEDIVEAEVVKELDAHED